MTDRIVLFVIQERLGSRRSFECLGDFSSPYMTAMSCCERSEPIEHGYGVQTPSSGHVNALPVAMCDTMRNLLLCFVRIPSLRASCGLSSELSVFGAARPANEPRLLHTIPFLLLISAGFLPHFPDLCSLQVVFCYSKFLLTVIRTPISPGNGKVAAEQPVVLYGFPSCVFLYYAVQ